MRVKNNKPIDMQIVFWVFIGVTWLTALMSDSNILLGAFLGGIFALISILYQAYQRHRELVTGCNLIVPINGGDYAFSLHEIASHDVDPQNGFTPLCPAELPVAGGELIVEELNEQAKLASMRTVSKDMHNPHAFNIATPENPQFTPVHGFPNLDIRWNSHCQSGTFGSELIIGLPNLLDYDFIAYKGMESDLHPYGACYHDLAKKVSTGLIEFYKYHGIKVVIVGGLALDYCVKETVLELKRAGFIVILNLAATREVAANTAITATDEMLKEGVIIKRNSQEIGEMFTNIPNMIDHKLLIK